VDKTCKGVLKLFTLDGVRLIKYTTIETTLSQNTCDILFSSKRDLAISNMCRFFLSAIPFY
jgi:hypothetical protein